MLRARARATQGACTSTLLTRGAGLARLWATPAAARPATCDGCRPLLGRALRRLADRHVAAVLRVEVLRVSGCIGGMMASHVVQVEEQLECDAVAGSVVWKRRLPIERRHLAQDRASSPGAVSDYAPRGTHLTRRVRCLGLLLAAHELRRPLQPHVLRLDAV